MWWRLLVAAKHGMVREPLKGSTGADIFTCSFRDRVCPEPDLAIWLNAAPRKRAGLFEQLLEAFCRNYRLVRDPKSCWVFWRFFSK